MAFQRFTRSSFKRTRNNFSRSRRNFMRKPGDRKWEKSQFHLGDSTQTILPTGSSASQLAMFHLASIQTSLSQNASAQPVGVVLGQMVRKLLIGGVEFDWGVEYTGPSLQEASDPADNWLWQQVGLCTDRAVSESGVADTPASLLAGWNPFQNAFPTSILSVSTPSSSLGSDDQDRPTHIHWKMTHGHSYSPFRLAVSEDLQVPYNQPVRVQRGHVSRRLRIVLDDQHALYFYRALQNGTVSASSDARGGFAWFTGTVFWRYVF